MALYKCCIIIIIIINKVLFSLACHEEANIMASWTGEHLVLAVGH